MAQQRVEGRQFSPLALVTHPDAFLCVPAARPVKQEEDADRFTAVLQVQRFNSLHRTLQQRLILRQCFERRIAKIGEQSEVQVGIAIGEEAYFQRFRQVVHILHARKQGGHHHQRARWRRDAGGKIHPRQWMRKGQQSRQPIDQRHCQLARAQQRGDADQRQQPSSDPFCTCSSEKSAGERRRQQCDSAQIKRQRILAKESPQQLDWRVLHVSRALQLQQSRADQVVPDMRCPRIGAGAAIGFCPGLMRQLNRFARHGAFGKRAISCNLLNHMPIAIPSGEIHFPVDAVRIFTQLLVDTAH